MFENMPTDFILREKCLNTEFCLEAVNYYHKALHLDVAAVLDPPLLFTKILNGI